jgi:hypothetical protein
VKQDHNIRLLSGRAPSGLVTWIRLYFCTVEHCEISDKPQYSHRLVMIYLSVWTLMILRNIHRGEGGKRKLGRNLERRVFCTWFNGLLIWSLYFLSPPPILFFFVIVFSAIKSDCSLDLAFYRFSKSLQLIGYTIRTLQRLFLRRTSQNWDKHLSRAGFGSEISVFERGLKTTRSENYTWRWLSSGMLCCRVW